MTAWTMKVVASSWVVPMQLVYRFHGTPSRSHYHGGILDHHSQASCFLHQCTKRILIWSRSRFWTLSLTESKVTLRFSPYRISRWAISPLVSHENPGKEALISLRCFPTANPFHSHQRLKQSQAKTFESHKLLTPPLAFSDSDFIAANPLFILSLIPML